MTVDEVVKYFETGYRFNQQTGMAHANFTNWVKKGFIPEYSQMKIEHLTNGALKADVTFGISDNK